jgi:hypothetical protein
MTQVNLQMQLAVGLQFSWHSTVLVPNVRRSTG